MVLTCFDLVEDSHEWIFILSVEMLAAAWKNNHAEMLLIHP